MKIATSYFASKYVAASPRERNIIPLDVMFAAACPVQRQSDGAAFASLRFPAVMSSWVTVIVIRRSPELPARTAAAGGPSRSRRGRAGRKHAPDIAPHLAVMPLEHGRIPQAHPAIAIAMHDEFPAAVVTTQDDSPCEMLTAAPPAWFARRRSWRERRMK